MNNTFLENVIRILDEQKITKNKLLTDLHLSKNSFIDWKKRGTIPSASVVSAIAEYLGVPISTLMGHPENEEEVATFPSKLTFQLASEGKTISELAQYLGVSDDTIMNWINGKSNTYNNYYEQLSVYFNVLPRYWHSPGMISPGIEPSTDEYLLISLYRHYKNTGIYSSDFYGELNYFFPNLQINSGLSYAECELLDRFNRLNSDNKIKAQSYMIELYERQKNNTTKNHTEKHFDSVAADEHERKVSGK